MKRLVYRPKVWAYVKTDTQSIDISPYIVSGSVSRVVNDVSTAELTLRNPDFKFTQPGSPTFRPMDPITIFMARDINHPVRVFTGFLDTTPYLQIFPGTVSIKASCTLKRLKYTYWDPALPFSKKFIYKFGWQSYDDGTTIKLDVDTQNTLDKRGSLNDGGFQDILFAVLEAVGHWNEKDIFIEELPPSIVPTVTKIFTGFKQESKETEKALKGFLEKAIGTTAAGAGVSSTSLTGDTSTGAQGNEREIVNTIRSVCEQNGIPPEFILAIALVETNLEGDNNTQSFSWGPNNQTYVGWYQWMKSGTGYAGDNDPWDISKANDLAYATGFICRAAKRRERFKSMGYPAWARSIQLAPGNPYHPNWGVNAANPSGNHLYSNSEFPTYVAKARRLLEKYKSSANSGSGSDSNPRPNDSRGGHARPKPAPTVTSLTGGLANDPIIGQIIGNTDPGGGPNGNGNRYLSVPGQGINGPVRPSGSGNLLSGISSSAGALANVGQTVARAATAASGGDAKTLATDILRYKGGLLTNPLSTTSDGKSANWVLEQVASKGYSVITHQASSKAVGTKVNLSVNMLKALKAALAAGIPLPINCLTNGKHATNSNHYNGNAVDFDGNASGWQSADGNHFKAFDAIARQYGGAHNFENPANEHHWHYDFTGGATGGVDPTAGGSEAVPSVSSGLSKESGQGIATAAAFAAVLELPGAMAETEAMAYSGQKSYINDVPLIEFIEQVCKSSMRSFQSLPDGRFYAFFPDYFGTFNPDRPPYWEIDDIEITEGEIVLSDEALKTHVYVVGDTAYDNQINMVDMLSTAGIVTIFNAFENNWLLSQKGSGSKVGLFKDAASFLEKYGVRPHFTKEPLIRSQYFEAFNAMNTFMLLWSRQFLTQFQFTFMPEIFPGGRVAFRNHDIVCYVDSVTHNFDYQGGFETFAQLSSPSAADTNNDEVMSKFTYGMVRSF